MQPSSPAIEVKNLHRTYRRTRRTREAILHPRRIQWCEALRGVQFEVAPGEVFGILGPNGAGKTSLVKILSTLVLPTAGEARVFGHDVVAEAATVLSRIGLVLADERSFYWRLTVRQNLRFFATLNDLDREQRRKSIEQALDAVEITEWADEAFSNLSAGLRQRVSLARAMLTDPPLLLMDEPTNSLDPHASHHFRNWISQELVGERGKTILLVTHDAAEAEQVCDRVGILKRGKFEFIGTPAKLVTRHAEHTGHRLRVSGWRDELRSNLAAVGLDVESPGTIEDGEGEIDVSLGELELCETFSLLAQHGVRIHDCEPHRETFPELVAKILDPALPEA